MPPVTRPHDSSVVWSSGLKTLPHAGRRTPVDTWGRENAKTIPNERPANPHMRSRTPGPQQDIHRESGWESGFKTLDREATLASPARRRNSLSGSAVFDSEWRGTNKVLDDVPSTKSRYSGEEHWMNENFKTIQPIGKTDRLRDFQSPGDWYAENKILRRPRQQTKRYHYAAAQETAPANTPSYDDGPHGGHSTKEARWISENFKTLHDDQSPYGYHAVRRAQTPTSVGAEDRDRWELGTKIVEQKPRRVAENTWARETSKTLPRKVMNEPAVRYINGKRHEIVVEGTGWDSGLYKTIEEPPRRYEIDDDWHKERKVLPNTPRRSRSSHGERDRHSSVNQSYDDLAPWRAPSKTIGAHSSLQHRRGAPARGHWDVESRKTLPLEERFAADHGHESTRYVLMPRRKDMWDFHDRVCRK